MDTIKKLVFPALLLGILIGFGACKKELNDYDLTIRVTVNDSIQVQNALVRVYAPVKDSYLDYYQYTNEQGETTFNIDRKAVVEVVASKGGYKGCGFKELFNGANNLLVIDLKPFGDNENGCQ